MGAQTVTTDANGNATLPFVATGFGQSVTATATNTATGDTSEFSACVQPTATFRTWISNAGGNWEDPTKWSDGVVPQPGEIVFIVPTNSDFTVSVQTADVALDQLISTARIAMSGGRISVATVAEFLGGLDLSGGELSGQGAIYLDGQSTWTGGTFSGAGSLGLLDTAALVVTMPSADVQLARTIVNLGTVSWNTAALSLNGQLWSTRGTGCSKRNPASRSRRARRRADGSATRER